MATATPPAVQGAPKTPTPKPYDPVQTVAGMFSGSIMRLAYVLQDPKNYSESTKIILAECTKKYQDALDDCQIQILDAKWYLERKLAENKARREAEVKAKEANTAPVPAPAKRKHDEVADISQQQQQQPPPSEGTPTKRARSSEQPSPTSAAAVANLSTTKEQPKPAETTQPASTSPARTTAPSQPQPQSKEPPKPVESEKAQPAEPEKKQPEPEPQQDHFDTDDFMRPTPQTTPALTNDEFNFESMFEGPVEDNNDATDNDELGMNFNMDDATAQFTQDDTNMNAISASNTQTNTQPQQQQQQPHSQPQSQPQELSGGPIPLLQGLEQFANQPDQFDSQNSTTNLTSQPMQNQPSNISNTSNPFTSNEPNIWDSMLADETMNFDNAEFENMEGMGNMGTTGSNPDDFGNMNMNMNIDSGDPNWDDMF